MTSRWAPRAAGARRRRSVVAAAHAAARAAAAILAAPHGRRRVHKHTQFSKIAGGISNILVKVSPKPGASRHSGSTSSGTGGAGAGLLSCLPCFGHGGGSATRGAHGSRKGRQLEPVAVKVFGEKTELLIDREAEARAVVALSAQGFGPKVRAGPVLGWQPVGAGSASLRSNCVLQEPWYLA